MRYLRQLRRASVAMAGVLTAALVAAMMLVLPQAASATLVAGAITGVSTTPTSVPRNGTLTTNFTFCVPTGTQAGDTFTLKVPAILTNIGSTLQLDDPGATPPQAVANGVLSGDTWTFTLTPYAAAHQNVCGSGHFTANFNGNEANGNNTLTYITNDGSTFTSQVNVTAVVGPDRTKPYKTGKFNTTTDQCRTDGNACITWVVQSEEGPLTSGTLTDTLNTVNVAAETLNCPTLATAQFLVGTPQASSPFISNTSPYAGTTSFSCSSSGFTWSFGAVPAGQIVQLSVTANTAKNSAGNVLFQNTVSGISNVHPTSQSISSAIQSGSLGGQANGDNVSITKWSTADGETAGAFDTAPGKQVDANTPTPITMTIKNTGTTKLTGITVSDVTTSGAVLTGLSCDFSQAVVTAPKSGVTWAGPMPAGTSFPCTGTIPGMAASTQESDTATVVATGNGPVTSSNPFNSYTPAPSVPPSVSVGDFVWVDSNGNGVQDSGEPGIPGVVLKVTGPSGQSVTDVNNNAVGPQTTDANGKYDFTNLPVLPAGQHYTVTIDQAASATALAGYTPTTAGAGTDRALDSSTGSATSTDLTTDGASDLTLDFGYVKPVTVGDYVWKDTNHDGRQTTGEPGIPGVVLTITDASGNPVKDVNGNPVGPQTTDSNGKYEFTNLPPGQYVTHIDTVNSATALTGLVPTTPNVGDTTLDSSTGQATSAVLPSGGSDQTLDYGYVPTPAVSVGDFVWADSNGNGVQDSGEPGIPGVVLKITGPTGQPVTDVNGAAVGEQTTDANGKYDFTNLPVLPAGQHYTVTIDQPASATALAGYSPTTAGAGSDRAVDSSTGSATSTDLTTDGASDLTLDFGYVKPVQVGDYVWIDTNHNGVQDSNEKGVPGVVLTITDLAGHSVTDINGKAVGPQTTDSNGKYLFTNLPPGQYVTHINYSTAPAGLVPTLTGKGTTATDSSTGSSTSVVLAAGEQDLTLDYGLWAPTPAVTITKGDTNGNAADTSATAPTLSDGTASLVFTVTNTGDEPLTNVTVSDSVISNGTVTGLVCTFPDGTTGLTWKGSLAVGASFPCTASLTGVESGSTHEDMGSVTATGSLSGHSVSATNPYYANRPAPVIALSSIDTGRAGNGQGPSVLGIIAGSSVILLGLSVLVGSFIATRRREQDEN